MVCIRTFRQLYASDTELQPPTSSLLAAGTVAALVSALRALHSLYTSKPTPALPLAHARPAGGLRARFHVGDAPMDVSAAEAAGAQAIGVTTGIYTRQELAQAGQSVVVLEGLQDLQSIFEVFNLS